jgi:predicted glycosyltransferase
MDGKGWKPQYGISAEGIEILGFVEALPREARRELADAVAKLCRKEGYLSLHDDLRDAIEKARRPPRSGKVIPLFKARQRG